MEKLKFYVMLTFGILFLVSLFIVPIFIEEAVERLVYDFVVGLFS